MGGLNSVHDSVNAVEDTSVTINTADYGYRLVMV